MQPLYYSTDLIMRASLSDGERLMAIQSSSKSISGHNYTLVTIEKNSKLSFKSRLLKMITSIISFVTYSKSWEWTKKELRKCLISKETYQVYLKDNSLPLLIEKANAADQLSLSPTPIVSPDMVKLSRQAIQIGTNLQELAFIKLNGKYYSVDRSVFQKSDVFDGLLLQSKEFEQNGVFDLTEIPQLKGISNEILYDILYYLHFDRIPRIQEKIILSNAFLDDLLHWTNYFGLDSYHNKLLGQLNKQLTVDFLQNYKVQRPKTVKFVERLIEKGKKMLIETEQIIRKNLVTYIDFRFRHNHGGAGGSVRAQINKKTGEMRLIFAPDQLHVTDENCVQCLIALGDRSLHKNHYDKLSGHTKHTRTVGVLMLIDPKKDDLNNEVLFNNTPQANFVVRMFEENMVIFFDKYKKENSTVDQVIELVKQFQVIPDSDPERAIILEYDRIHSQK